MGEMVNLALGPIGLFIIAAQTLSSWLNQTRVSADEAAQAMHRYVGAMATMESVKKAQSRIKDIDATLGDGADGFTMKTEIGMSAARRKQLEDERNQLRGYVTAESPNAYANFGRQQADQLGYERQNYRDRINAQKDFQDQYQALQAKALAGDKQAGQQLAALRDGQLAKERGWLADRINLTNRQLQQAQRIPDPAKRANTIAVLTARLGGLNQQMDTMGQQGANSADLITEALAGKGKNGKNTLSAADKAANRIAGLQGNIAALQAQVAGDKSTNLIKFMATLNSGGFRGKSPAEISLLRQQALLKDSVKGTEDARSANERYDSMMGQVTGRIAEMVAEMDGSAGNLAKFEARLKAATGADGSLGGAFKGFTPEKIAALRQAYQGQDETEHGKAIDGAFDKLSKEFVKADESSQALWESFKNGSIEADRHTDELRGRFMSIIDGLKLAPDELEKWKGKVDEIVNKMKENEGILEAFRLDQDTKKINNTLIGDERAQRIAETQREIDDEQSKIETALNAITGMDAESIKKRMRINAAFYDWKKAKEAELVRANESSTVKMMRQWAQLGNNMEQVLSGAISSFVDQLASGKLNVKDFAKEVLKELLKVILQALIAYAILSALGMTPTGSGGQPLSFGQYMGQSVSSGFGGGAAPTWEAPKHHDGGIIGTSKSFARVNSAMFDGAFKYHGGGVIDKLGPREVPMIGLEGERVLTEDDQRALAAGQKPNVTVNVINNSGEQLNADVGTEFNGKDMIISVVLDAMNKQGPLRDAMAGMHGK
jgi:lambda family phage tail tape measure protein